MRITVIIAALVGVAAFPLATVDSHAAAAAQERLTAPAPRANPLEEVVVTASRTRQPVSEVASNISLIRAETLNLVGHTHISEAMQRVAGAWISRGNGQEHLTALRSPVLTGAGACGAFLMAQDGIPLRASGFCNVNELFDANTEQAGRIEVIKGPASVMYGSNAMHGMINVLTPAVSPERTLVVEAGPHEYRRAKGSFATRTLRLDVNGATDGGWKDHSGFDQQKLTAKHEGTFGEWQATTVLAGANLNQETAGFVVGEAAYRDPALRQTNPNPEAFRDVWSIRLHSSLRRSTGDGEEIVVTPYARATGMDFLQHFLPGQALEQNGHRSVGLQSAWHGERWTAGVDAELTSGFLKETQPNETQGPAFLVETIYAGKHYDYEVDAATLAAFVRVTQPLTDEIELSAGLRAERVRYDYDNLMLTGRTRDDGTPCGFGGCRFNRPADRTDTFDNLSPRFGLTWRLGDDSQLFAYASRGFRAPQTSELYRLQNTQSVSNIDSESLTSLEAGLRGARDAVSYEMSAYVMEKDNFIFRDTSRTNVDNGETSHRGLEVSLAARLNDSVSAALDWSYAIHRYENNPTLASAPIAGNDIDTAPRHLGSASLRWQPHARLYGEIEWVHLGEYFQDPENEEVYPGHDLVNLRARVSLTGFLNAYIRITNLTDEAYAERADFAFGADRYFVGEPRSLYVGLEASF